MAVNVRNLFVCDTEVDLPPNEEGVAMVKSKPSGFYSRPYGGNWAWIQVSDPESSWPLDSVFCVSNEKDPSDLLGFGKWELIQKEPFFAWKRVG